MLTSLSPLDGRYEKQTEPLFPIFSEMGFMRYRVIAETEYLIALSNLGLPQLRNFSDEEKSLLRNLQNLSSEQAQIISDIEKAGYKDIPATNHDVKAVEYFLKLELSETSLKDVLEWIHFALTSEDTNNLSYGMMLSDGLTQVILPSLNEIYFSLNTLATKYKNAVMLARTHGQSASPTTFGKELKVFAYRLRRQLDQLSQHKILGKLNGATGNYNAHVAAYPNVDWIKFSQDFIGLLATHYPLLTTNLLTTQIESHDAVAELCDNLKRINTILIGFDQDVWRYVSDGWIKQKSVAGEIGSSTMPHKVNPINFENSEGNLGMANAILDHLASKLPISRLQRDLTDSTVQRNLGSAFGYCQVAYKYLLRGLSRITPDEEKMKAEVMAHPEVLAEAIQTILRREGQTAAYEKLKELTRGKEITLADIHTFIDTLDVPEQIKSELKTFTPENYIGITNKLVEI
jgi:adenylosuccinate lyase